MTYSWLLFDADGTLFDYDQAEASALRDTFLQLAGTFDDRFGDVYRGINHQIWLDFEQGKITAARLRTRRFQLLLEELGVEVDPERFSERYLANLAASSQLIDGAEEVINALNGRYRLMIITNGLSEVQRPRLARSTIAGAFRDLIISEEVGSAKPDSGIFDVAFERMGQPIRREVLIIGDSLTSDIRGGVNYGIDTCWFNPKRRPPVDTMPVDYQIADLRQLLDILG